MVKQQLDSQMPDYYMSIEFTEYMCPTTKSSVNGNIFHKVS